ncbi:hypothetical protein [Sphingomonas jaspsi]|uniref:hypothetical protein n=1 Tax=Sphingomonas jaspsi TaxID=392409 RepID=UPI0004AE3DD3|nr:hypothetical protein [Sphingomonas jaspsi]
MLALLLAAAAEPQDAIAAERAFIADAQKNGQWTAFRNWAAFDALMFTPEPTYAQDFLRKRADPPQSVDWAPALSIVSCDGRVAVNHGPWWKGDGHGTFTTIWFERDGKWRWTYDGGQSGTAVGPVPKDPTVRKASCNHLPPRGPANAYGTGRLGTPDGKAPSTMQGSSDDMSLRWGWTRDPDAKERRIVVETWNGWTYDVAFAETVADE